MSSVPAVHSEDVVWHFFDSRKLQRGPVSGIDLLWFFAAGHVNAETYCWRAGLADWAPWAQVPDLVLWQKEMEGLQKPWFYMDSQMCKQGPVEEDILKDMKRAGLLSEHSRVWKKGDIGWKSYEDQPDLAGPTTSAASAPTGATESAAPRRGAPDSALSADALAKRELNRLSRQRKRAASAVQRQTSVYLTGLPTPKGKAERARAALQKDNEQSATEPDHITEDSFEELQPEELAAFCSKAGLLKVDDDGLPRVKLYRTASGSLQGDGLAIFALPESVQLAIDFLNGREIEPGWAVTVERAQHAASAGGAAADGAGDDAGDVPAGPVVKRGKHKSVAARAQAQALSWADEGSAAAAGAAGGGLRIVVILFAYSPEEAEASGDANAYYEGIRSKFTELAEDIGPVHKLSMFPGNTQGPIVIKFKTGTAAAECIKRMHNAPLGPVISPAAPGAAATAGEGEGDAGRGRVRCTYFDGKTNFKVVSAAASSTDAATAAAAAAEEEARLKAFGDWLEQQDSDPSSETIAAANGTSVGGGVVVGGVGDDAAVAAALAAAEARAARAQAISSSDDDDEGGAFDDDDEEEEHE